MRLMGKGHNPVQKLSATGMVFWKLLNMLVGSDFHTRVAPAAFETGADAARMSLSFIRRSCNTLGAWVEATQARLGVNGLCRFWRLHLLN